MKPTNEQTVQFELRVHYRQIERPDHRPASETFAFDSFEKMIARYYKERRRRALAARAPGGGKVATSSTGTSTATTDNKIINSS